MQLKKSKNEPLNIDRALFDIHIAILQIRGKMFSKLLKSKHQINVLIFFQDKINTTDRNAVAGGGVRQSTMFA